MAGKSKKVKILFTIPNFDTAGSGKALFKIASGLNRDFFEPHIACLHDKGDYVKVIKEAGIPLHVFPFISLMRPVFKGLFACLKKSRFFAKHDFDVVHSFHYGPDYSEALSVKMAGIKWGFTKKNMSWGGASKNGWKLRSFVSDFIAIQNRDMKKDFYPSTNKTYYVPRGVDASEFFKTEPDSDLRHELGIDANAMVILNVANMVPVKGLDVLIKAFKNLPQDNAVLLLVGDNISTYGHNLDALTKILNIENKVIFVGKKLNVKHFLSIADIFVLPTLNEGRKEGSPVALLEAMASGLPVIGTKIPGVKEQLQNFPDSLVEPGNVDALTSKIDFFLSSDIQWRKQYGERLRSEVAAFFDIETEIKRHEQMYLDVLKLRFD